MNFEWNEIFLNLDYIMHGMVITLKVVITAVIFGMLWGTILTIMRLSSNKILHWFAVCYVNMFRSIPLVMVLLWFYLLIPELLTKFFDLSPETDIRLISAMIAFSLFEAAYYSEIIRAGISSVAKGQFYASLALGMTSLQSMRLVILPQAFRIITPLLVTQGIILLQDATLVYILSLADFFYRSVSIIGGGGTTDTVVTMIIFTAVTYFVICFSISLIVNRLKKRTV